MRAKTVNEEYQLSLKNSWSELFCREYDIEFLDNVYVADLVEFIYDNYENITGRDPESTNYTLDFNEIKDIVEDDLDVKWDYFVKIWHKHIFGHM